MKRISLILAISLALSFILAGCAAEKPSVEYSIRVETEWKSGLSDIGIRVYSDSDLTDLVWGEDPIKEGLTTFTAPEGSTYYAVITNIPEGYAAKEYYMIKDQKTVITLKTELLSPESLKDTSFGLGSVFLDFTVTDANGNTHTLSELLKTKKAVVLNFWFLNCDPCRMEFPYLEEAYGKYKEDIEVIAINPVDGTDDKLLAYAMQNGLTVPMACGEAEWESSLSLNAYPTTLVIDRNGIVALKHTGAVTGEGQFEAIFRYFTSEDYSSKAIRNLSDIIK